MKNDKIILSKDEMFAYDPKYGKRYQAVPAPMYCKGCKARPGGRLCKSLPCNPDSVSKPCREDGQLMIWIPKHTEIQK
jgi:hypothetical protein